MHKDYHNTFPTIEKIMSIFIHPLYGPNNFFYGIKELCLCVCVSCQSIYRITLLIIIGCGHFFEIALSLKIPSFTIDFYLQDSYQEPTMLQCKHIFCEECVSTWFDRDTTCPMCRAKVRVSTWFHRDTTCPMCRAKVSVSTWFHRDTTCPMCRAILPGFIEILPVVLCVELR